MHTHRLARWFARGVTLVGYAFVLLLSHAVALPTAAQAAQPIGTYSAPRVNGLYPGFFNSMALTSSDVPVIAYYESEHGDLKLATCTDAACTAPYITTLDSTGNVGLYPSIALTNSDIPVISYQDYTNGDVKLAVCNNTRCTNPTLVVVESDGTVGAHTSMALRADNTPVIAYNGPAAGRLKIALCDTILCAAPNRIVLDSAYSTGYYTDVEITSTDIPVVSYHDQNVHDLKLAVCADSACTSATTYTLESAGDVGLYTSLALKTNNAPVVSYYDLTNSNLNLAICPQLACTTPAYVVVDASGVVGSNTSIALTSANLPIVSYLDQTAGTVKLARCNNSSCDAPVYTTIDTVGITHTDTSLALTSAGTPFLSYYEYTNGYLKLYTGSTAIIDQGQPGSFATTAPANTATISETAPTLRWETVADAESYEYCIATVSADCTTWISVGTTPSATLSGLIDGTTYVWHVRAINGSGTTYANSNTQQIFTVQSLPGNFTKSAPSNLGTISTTAPTLAWTSSSAAASYEYCYATSAAACTTWKNAGNTRSAKITGLAHNTTYYWQVRAKNTAGTTAADTSALWRFTVRLSPAAFAKTAPAHNATNQKTALTLSWAASTNATSYEYCIAKTVATCTLWKSTGAARTATVSGLAKNTAYYWQVRAKNSAGATVSSTAHWKFTTSR
ncbi:MAG: hypothetical protein RLZZ297_1577 [Chloroflexota bacterium]|jgi:hypothetical protein